MSHNKQRAPSTFRAIGRFLKAIPVGPGYDLPRSVPNTMCSMLDARLEVWKDGSFGLLRLLRLALAHIQIGNPFNLICSLLDLIHPIWSRLFTDIYVVLKFTVPIMLLMYAPQASFWTLALAAYIIVETILYLYTQILVTTSKSGPESTIRTFVMILLDYLLVNLCFAWIYFSRHLIPGVSTPIEAVYFAFVTGSTTGFGDLVPKCPAAYRVVIAQILSSVSFLGAFFAYFLPPGKSSRKP